MKNKGVAITATILIFLVFFLCIYDVIIGASFGSDATISKVVYKVSCGYPLIPFGVGCVFGHIFGAMKSEK